MSERPSYVCAECGERVNSASYRASCPHCGSTLRPEPFVGD